jgi:uncharacterized protein
MTRFALITGATSGIGWDLAGLFARDGYGLVLVARRLDLLEARAKQFRLDGAEVHVFPVDLSQPGAASLLLLEMEKSQLNIDVLVHNAGFTVAGPFSENSAEAENAMVHLHNIAMLEFTKPLLQGMLKRGQGRILNVASTAGFQPGPGMAVYYATKAFIISFSEALGEELRGTGVTVTVLCPGPTRTGFLRAAGLKEPFLFRIMGMTSHAVAEYGYRALMAGQSMAVPGIWNNLGVFLLRLSPRTLVKRVVKRIQATEKA